MFYHKAESFCAAASDNLKFAPQKDRQMEQDIVTLGVSVGHPGCPLQGTPSCVLTSDANTSSQTYFAFIYSLWLG